MVTVDGRQDASFGLTQREMAELLVELGAYDAINLDGGGSASIIARPLGMKDPVILNSPSDGVPRQIPNMIGITTSAPESPLYGLIVKLMIQTSLQAHQENSPYAVMTGISTR